MPKDNSPFKNDLFFHNLSIPTIILSVDFTIIDINKSALSLFGYTKKQIFGKKVSEFTDKNNFYIDIDKVKSLLNSDIQSYKVRRTYYDKNKKPLEGNVTISLIRNSGSSMNYLSAEFNVCNKNESQLTGEFDLDTLKTILKKSPVIQWISDLPLGKLIYENINLLQYLGYTDFDFDTNRQKEFFYSKLIKKSVKVKIGKKNGEEYSILNKQGKEVWFYSEKIPIKIDFEGKIIQSYGMAVDITERKEKEKKIKEQEVFVKSISNSINDFIYVLDLDEKTMSYKNNKCFDLLGYSAEEFSFLNKSKLIHKNDREAIKNYRKIKFNSKNTNHKIDVRFKHKTKGYRWFRFKSVIFERDEENNIVKILETISDINDLKTKELENLKQHTLIKSLLDSMNEFTYVSDISRNHEIIFNNNNSKKILGYTIKEYFLLKPKDLIHKDYKELINTSLKALKNTQKKVSFRIEVLLKHKKKGYRWYKIKNTVFEKDKDGKAKTLIKTIEDIHEDKLNKINIINTNEFIKTINSSLPISFYIFDLKKNSLAFSSSKIIVGYTHKEYFHEAVSIIHPDFKDEASKASKQIYSSTVNKFHINQFKFKHKTKGYRWYEVKTKIFKRNKDGSASQILEIIEDIDDRKLTELKISKQENLIQKVSKTSLNYFFIQDIATEKTIFTNYSNKKYIGHSSKDLSKGNIYDFIEPSQKNDFFYFLKNIKKQNNSKIFQIDLKIFNKRKNEYQWFSNSATIFEHDDKGNPLSIIFSLRNIDKNKTSFLKIVEQQKFINNISNSIPQFLSVWNVKDSQCFYTNFEKRKVFGYTRKEFINNGINYIHPDYRHILLEVGALIKTSKVLFENEFEILVKHKTKGYRWANLKIVTIETDTYGYATQTLEILEDIHKQKLANIKVMEQQNFIEKINSTIPSIIQVYNIKEKKISYSNFKNRIFLGYNKREWLKTKKDIVLKEHYESLIAEIKLLLTNKSNKNIFKEIQILNKNGEYKWIDFRMKVFLRDEKGFPLQIATIFRDIDIRSQLNQKLIKSRKLLDNQVIELRDQLNKNTELERFASIASHDLKEPLRTIRNYSQILNATNRDNLDEDGKVLIDYIENSTKRMSNLVQDILTFSKIGKDALNKKQFELSNTLETIKTDLSELLKSKQAKIIIRKMPNVFADENQIRQVFQNLISNAIKFNTKKNSIVKIKYRNRKNDYLFSVEDNGIGIKEKDKLEIFSAFKKLHNIDQFEGQGIGLSICKSIIENHNGEIWLESELKKGTTFFFTIPKKN